MKIFFVLLLSFQLNISTAGNYSVIILISENLFVGDELVVGVGISCPMPAFGLDGQLMRNVIVEGNIIKLFTYTSNEVGCPPVLPPGYAVYNLGDLGLSEGTYVVELYELDENVLFPLPDNYSLVLTSELQFGVMAPVIIDSSSNYSLSILILLLLSIGFIAINRKIGALKY